MTLCVQRPAFHRKVCHIVLDGGSLSPCSGPQFSGEAVVPTMIKRHCWATTMKVMQCRVQCVVQCKWIMCEAVPGLVGLLNDTVLRKRQMCVMHQAEALHRSR